MEKLSNIEASVLEFLIKNGSSTSGIPINIPDIEMPYLIQAVHNLDKMGLVKQCNDLCSANAFLTQKGLTYFDDLEKEEFGVYYNEIKKIENSISELNTLEDNDDGHEKFSEICEIYNYIKGLKAGVVDYGDPLWQIVNENIRPFKSNVNIVSERLKQYIEILKQKAKKEKITPVKNNIKNVFNPQNTVNVNNSIEVNITQTISNIVKLDNSELSDKEKQEIQRMLFELDELKNSKKKRNLLKN